MRRRLAEPNDRQLAWALVRKAHVLDRLGRSKEMLATANEAMAIWERLDNEHRGIVDTLLTMARDLLPIVEGTTVQTRYGAVTTDHMLFIAAGAFHRSKPSDLMPELQGRFPIRVELNDLTRDDFVRILTEPSGSLTRSSLCSSSISDVTPSNMPLLPL